MVAHLCSHLGQMPSHVLGRSLRASGRDHGVGVPEPFGLGAGGVEKIVDFKLTDDEQKLFDESASHVEELVGVVKNMFPELA